MRFLSAHKSFSVDFFFKPIIYYFTSTNKLEKCEKAAQIKNSRNKILNKFNSNLKKKVFDCATFFSCWEKF